MKCSYLFQTAVLFSMFAICTPAPTTQILLQSKLSSNPIEDPVSWAWGQHPDGLDYKAKNSLTLKQCLANPCSLLGTPLCKTTYFHCAEYECIQKTNPCKKYCKVLGTCWQIYQFFCTWSFKKHSQILNYRKLTSKPTFYKRVIKLSSFVFGLYEIN